MNLIASNIQTMSSREIAKLTGKRHGDVIRDIAETLSQAEIDISKFASIYLDTMNRSQPEYLLPKRECDLVISGYSVKYRLAIIDRWQELEANQAPAIPVSYAAALQLAADQAKALEEAGPKVAFVDKYVAATTGNKGFREVCKLLKVKENIFRKFLEEKRIMYKLGTNWTAYQPHIDAGRFETKTGEANEHAFTVCQFTPKGVAWIAGEWAKFNEIGEGN